MEGGLVSGSNSDRGGGGGGRGGALKETFVGHFGYLTMSLLCHVPSCFCQNVLEGLDRDRTGGHIAILIMIWKVSGWRNGPALFSPQ